MPHLYANIQAALIAAIGRPEFNAALPPLSDSTWTRLLEPSNRACQENERLEFLGDALMYATIGRQLYSQIPDGTPHLYTDVRAALHSNVTFSHLAEKLDILAVSSTVLKALTVRTFGEGVAAPSKTRPQVKATADLFETVIGAYYLDAGFEALCDWVHDIYTPLIRVAEKTFTQWQAARKKRFRPPTNSKFLVGSMTKNPRLTCSPLKASHGYNTRSVRRSTRKQGSTHANVTPQSKASWLSQPRRSELRPVATTQVAAAASAVEPKKPKCAVLIDLTLDSESSDDDDIHLITTNLDSSPCQQRRQSSRAPGTPALLSLKRLTQPLSRAIVAEDDEDSRSEDEDMLEQMLTSRDYSNMDLSSDDIAGSDDMGSSLGPVASGSSVSDKIEPSSSKGSWKTFLK